MRQPAGGPGQIIERSSALPEEQVHEQRRLGSRSRRGGGGFGEMLGIVLRDVGGTVGLLRRGRLIRSDRGATGVGDDDVIVRLHRSEEHTSELQSLMRISYAVFCLKKKNNTKISNNIHIT